MSELRQNDRWISPEEYLEMELRGEVRHEYFAGDLYAMAGASVEHNRIAGDIFTTLNLHLRGHRCEVFINDMKAHLQRDDRDWFYYPDILVNCDPDGQKKYYCDTPAIIFEVLSPSTEALDHREKRLAYELIPSLHTYVLVAQDRRAVYIHRRRQGGWDSETLPADGNRVRLPELACELSLDDIYARVPQVPA